MKTVRICLWKWYWSLQLAYNEAHGITPQAIVKARNRIVGLDRDAIEELTPAGAIKKPGRQREKKDVKTSTRQQQLPYEIEYTHEVNIAADPVIAYMRPEEMRKNIEKIKQQMVQAAKKMDFLEAARLRDEMLKMQELLDTKEEAK